MKTPLRAAAATPAVPPGEPGLIVSDAPLEALLADARRRVWVCGSGPGHDEARAALPWQEASAGSVT